MELTEFPLIREMVLIMLADSSELLNLFVFYIIFHIFHKIIQEIINPQLGYRN